MEQVKQKPKTETQTTCLNRFIGRCQNCTPDYDPNHHPNNLDCKNYHPIKVHYFNVK